MANIPATPLPSDLKNTSLASLLRPRVIARPMTGAGLPTQLQELLDETVVTPTLKERLENWGSD